MVTYAQLLNARDTMIELSGTKLPGRLTLKVSRSAQALFKALELVEGTRQSLLRQFCEFDDADKQKLNEEGRPLWNTPESEAEFKAELAAAVDEDSDVKFIPVLLKHFPQDVLFTPQDAAALEAAGIIKES